MKRIIGILTLSCLLFSACGKDEIPQEENEKKTEETTPGDDTGGDESDDDPDSPKLVVPLHVEGRYLKNEQGKIVNLHGFTQTYSPYFNNNAWSNYDVSSCLSYNKSMVDKILAAGWKFNFVRLHMDPYWSDDTTLPYVRYEGHERFSETRFKKYLKELFVPMAEYFISKGMYVVMRPPGVCPHAGDTEDNRYLGIELGDSYQEFLLKVWDIVSQNAVVKNNPGIMFELANEPVHIKGTDGKYGGDGDACFINMQKYFQAIVDKIRGNACNNIIWVPGLGWQSQYSGYKDHRIEGENIGFAVHCYPGWYGSDAEQDSGEGNGSSTGGGYEPFQRGWDKQVGPVASFAPVMVTDSVPDAGAEAHFRAGGHRRHRPEEGRRCVPPGKRRQNHGRQLRLRALHPGGRDGAARRVQNRPQGQGMRGSRPLEHRRQADEHASAAPPRHRNHLPQPHAEPR